MDYIQSNGDPTEAIFEIGRDIDEGTARVALSLGTATLSCADGLMADGCVVHEIVERGEWVWVKVKLAVNTLKGGIPAWKDERGTRSSRRRKSKYRNNCAF